MINIYMYAHSNALEPDGFQDSTKKRSVEPEDKHKLPEEILGRIALLDAMPQPSFRAGSRGYIEVVLKGVGLKVYYEQTHNCYDPDYYLLPFEQPTT